MFRDSKMKSFAAGLLTTTYERQLVSKGLYGLVSTVRYCCKSETERGPACSWRINTQGS